MSKNNNWQELQREEKQFKDERGSPSSREKRPYKRDKQQGRWWEEYDSEEGDENEFDPRN
jgi:hypothetical protein